MRPLPATQSPHELLDLGQLDASGLAAICRAWLGCHDDLLLLMTGDGEITHLAGSHAPAHADLAARLDGAAWRGLWCKTCRREAAAALAQAAAGRPARFQASMPAPGGDLWFDVALAPIANESAGAAVLAVLRDVTLFKREDERQAQSRRLEAIGRLAGGVAHDFNNLLTVILSANEALAEAAPEGESRHLANVSLQAAGRGAELIRRLLAFARPSPRAPHAADATSDVSGAVEAASRLLQRTLPDNIRFEACAPQGLIWCRADRSELENALLNLCVNARDAMPAGGRLSLGARLQTLDRAEAQALQARPGDYVVFTVEDSGAGMSPDTAARAIEPFFSTKTKSGGTGLGLSSVNSLAVSAGGALRIQSRIGHGARISLYLPRAKTATQSELDLKPGVGTLPAAAVLLVEDEPAVRAEAARLLRAMGCQVTEAEDAEVALATLTGEGVIDLMITDMDLPFGLDGAALAEAGRALRPDLKVLFVSGGFAPSHAAPDTLAKPFGRAALFAAVQRQLERRPVSSQQ